MSFGAFYLLSLYLQGTFGYSALGTGVAFVPITLGMIGGSMLAGRLVPRTGPRPTLLVGLTLGAVGIAWFTRLSGGGIGLAVLVTVAGAAADPTAGTHRAFVLAAGLMVVGVIVAFLLVKDPERRAAR